jgi:hypothetical protein
MATRRGFLAATALTANADVSLRANGKPEQIVTARQDRTLDGDNLTYTIKLLQCELPASGANVSVFIDLIGRPLTPFSYAGVARRADRRAYDWR